MNRVTPLADTVTIFLAENHWVQWSLRREGFIHDTTQVVLNSIEDSLLIHLMEDTTRVNIAYLAAYDSLHFCKGDIATLLLQEKYQLSDLQLYGGFFDCFPASVTRVKRLHRERQRIQKKMNDSLKQRRRQVKLGFKRW